MERVSQVQFQPDPHVKESEQMNPVGVLLFFLYYSNSPLVFQLEVLITDLYS